MKNLTTDIFVLCDHALISREQKLSIIGIFDQFFVANLPTSWPKMFLVAVVSGEPQKEYSLRLKLVSPKAGENKLPDKELKVTLGANGKANIMTELANFPLPDAGVYKISLETEEETVGALEFRVNKTTPTYTGADLAGKKVSN